MTLPRERRRGRFYEASSNAPLTTLSLLVSHYRSDGSDETNLDSAIVSNTFTPGRLLTSRVKKLASGGEGKVRAAQETVSYGAFRTGRAVLSV